MANKKITFTKKECEHIAEWLPKICFSDQILKKYQSEHISLAYHYEDAKTEKEKKKIKTIMKKLGKYYEQKKYEWEDLSESIINKIEREYQWQVKEVADARKI